MRFRKSLSIWALLSLRTATVDGLPTSQAPLLFDSSSDQISVGLFSKLEELARLVDISYCVGTSGITKPFLCASRCSEFDGFELVTAWETGPLLSDSCGYVALSHPPFAPRIIIAFRGTYSIANTVADLSTVPQEYVPYPPDDTDDDPSSTASSDVEKCLNCTVHSGFLRSWTHTRPHILPHLEEIISRHPSYQLTLVGHSLGGAVAALASLDFHRRGWNPHVTTFGEPRVGNQGLVDYIDARFASSDETETESDNGTTTTTTTTPTYYRVTHVDDPVPLLPLTEWGYRPHANEIYISKPALSPSVDDLHYCDGDEDRHCIAGGEATTPSSTSPMPTPDTTVLTELPAFEDWWSSSSNEDDRESRPIHQPRSLPSRFKLWQLFFAHRDYFWRIGLCVPGGDPGGAADWWRRYGPDLGFNSSSEGSTKENRPQGDEVLDS
ncbi:MAG: hypothetical protein M1837_003701 [Sclerophora amabilis]|nr:MAG: hypothetical protein M1837_003701 [Sclerophora amabilis]